MDHWLSMQEKISDLLSKNNLFDRLANKVVNIYRRHLPKHIFKSTSLAYIVEPLVDLNDIIFSRAEVYFCLSYFMYNLIYFTNIIL